MFDIVDIHVADDALLVNHKDRALGRTHGAQNAERFGHLAVRPKVAQEWIRDAAQTLCPCPEAVRAVYADTQNLGTHPFEPVKCGLVGRDLGRSDGGPGKGEKRDDDISLPSIVTQGNRPPIVTLEGKIGCGLSNLGHWRHMVLLDE